MCHLRVVYPHGDGMSPLKHGSLSPLFLSLEINQVICWFKLLITLDKLNIINFNVDLVLLQIVP